MKFGHLRVSDVTRIAFVASATAVAAACAATPVPTGSDGNAARAQAALAEGGRHYQEVETLQWRIVQKCMAAKGFTVHPRRAVSEPLSRLEDPLGRSPDLAAARSKGYGLSEAEPEPAVPTDDPFDTLPATEKRRYAEAENGSTGGKPAARPGGCVREAMDALYGKGKEAAALPLTDVFDAARSLYANNVEVRRAISDWAECVGEAGYPVFRDPNDVRRYASYFYREKQPGDDGPVPQGGPWPPTEARVKEVALATADATCADQLRTGEVQEKVWRTVTDRVYADFEVRLVAYRDEMKAQLARGQEALGE